MTPPPPKRRKKELRCDWCLNAPENTLYHDTEWGVPVYDDHKMFEFLLLETFQAGLNWLLILRRRAAFAAAFHHFDVHKVANMTAEDMLRLSQDRSIVRNKLKIKAAVTNAQAVIQMSEQGTGLAHYFWQWVDYKPVHNLANGNIVTNNHLSDQISKDLKKRGFKFVGSTVIYAHLQATGIVNDHAKTCPRYEQVQKLVRDKPQ